jgi:hypothetical protein
MDELSGDLIKALWENRRALVINCFVDEKGETRGITDKDQASLDLYEAVKDLPGFDGKGPLMIVRTLETKEEGS